MDNLIIERIIQRQIKTNERVLKEIGKIIREIGELTPSEAYIVLQQVKYGDTLQRIVKILAKNSQLTEVEIYKMLENEAKTNLALKEALFKANKVDYIPYKENVPLQNLVKSVALTTMNTYRNISATTGLTFLDKNKNVLTRPIQEAYWQIIDDAIVNVSTGKQTFQDAMLDQLQTIGEAGIQSIEYATGHHRRIDSALRMNLQDGLNQLAIAQQELVGQQFNADGWEITVHENPAEDHEEVQGHMFTNEEYEKLQTFGEAKDVNGKIISLINKYGSFRPIGELNCQHFAFSIVVGVSKPRYTEEELEQIKRTNKKGFNFEGKHYTNYEGTQLQRRLELELRKSRETTLLAKESNNQELIEKSQNKERILVRKYRDLSKASGLPTRFDKVKIMLK